MPKKISEQDKPKITTVGIAVILGIIAFIIGLLTYGFIKPWHPF